MMRRTVKNNFFSRPKTEFYLAAAASYSGQVDDVDSVHIHGRIMGNIHCRATLYVYPGAEVSGDILAQAVVIEGNVHGDITAGRRVKLCRGARLLGNLNARRVDLADGSYFLGRIEMPPDAGREFKRRLLLLFMGLRQRLTAPQPYARRLTLLGGLAVAILTFLLLQPDGRMPVPVVVKDEPGSTGGIAWLTPSSSRRQFSAPLPSVSGPPAPTSDYPGPTEALSAKNNVSPPFTPEIKDTNGVLQSAQLPVGREKIAQPVTLPTAGPSDRDIKAFLERWRGAWQESADIGGKMNAYFSFYGDDFIPESGTRKSWRQDKLRNTKEKPWIRVGISHIFIDRKNIAAGRVEIRFRQHYRSPNFNDTTHKRLLLAVTGERLRILKEETIPGRR